MMNNANARPWARAHAGWFTCRMNELYYVEKLRRLKRWDFWLRLTSTVLASAGVITAVRFVGSEALTVTMGVLAACITGATMVMKLSDQIQAAAAMLPQYTRAAAVFRELYFASDDADEAAVIEAWRALDGIHVTESEKIPDYDEALLLWADGRTRTEFAATTALAA